MLGPFIPYIHAAFVAVRKSFKEWRRKRRWNADLQLYYLRVRVTEDARWLAHDPVASALCERYLNMLADDWERRPYMPVSAFRESLGLDPHQKRGGEHGKSQ